jgi:hypothetical protein
VDAEAGAPLPARRIAEQFKMNYPVLDPFKEHGPIVVHQHPDVSEYAP